MTLSPRAAALALALLAPLAQAAPPAEVFFREPDIVEAVLSPSGRRLAITTAKGASRVGLAVIDLGPGGKPSRVAQFSDGDVRDVHWVNEDRLVFGVVDFFDGSGKPTGAPGLFAVNSDGSKFRQLVRRQGRPFISTPGEQRMLDWNHHVLRVPVPTPGQANEDILVAEFSADEDGLQRPLWLNTRTGFTRSTGVKAPLGTVGWMADSHGDLRAAFTRDKGRHAAWWRAPGSSEWTQLFDSELLTQPFGIVGIDDAGGLYVTRAATTLGYHWLARYDFQAHQPESSFIVQTPGFDFQGALLTETGSSKAQGVRIVVDAETTVWFDAQMTELQARADNLFPGYVNHISCRRCGQPDMVAVVRSFSDHDPGRLYLYQAQPPEGEKAWRAIGMVMEGVKPEQMAGMELQRIKARDGRDLPVWVTRPDGAKGPLPAVVLVHGGPWVRGRAWGWHAKPQFLASRGYVVIEPEMRGSTGYGNAHFKAGFKQWGQAMQDDVADALRWAQAQGIASDKACIAGDSYGGYSTLMGLVNDPDLFRCGVAGLAVTDLDLYLRGSWWVVDDISNVGRTYTLPDMVGDPEKDAAMIAAHSPVKLAARIKSPVMLVFGEDDRRVPLAHGERMRKALHEAGNEPVWVTYPDEAHGLGSVKNRVDYALRMEAFLARYLGPTSP